MSPILLFLLTAKSLCTPLQGMTPDLEKSILYISGANDISDVPQNEVEQYEAMAAHPLQINTLSRSRLLSCGLFTSYQAECIMDYRARCGDILSRDELSSVDGFTPILACHLSSFLDFTAGSQSGTDWILDAVAGSGFKYTGRDQKDKIEGGFGQYYSKIVGGVRTKVGEFAASAAMKSEWSRPLAAPDQIGASVSYDGKRYLTRIAAGCFNARFGQGLVQWSGQSYDSFTSPQALMKRPSGIAAYSSWSSDNALMGAGARVDIAMFSLSPFADIRGHIFGGNLAWNHRNGQVGATFRYGPDGWKASVDFQQTVSGIVIFGETRIVETVLGVRFPISISDNAVRIYHSSCEHNLSYSTSVLQENRKYSVDFSLSTSYFQSDRSRTPRGAVQVKSVAVFSAQPWSNWAFTTKGSITLRTLTRLADIEGKYTAAWPMMKLGLRQDVLFENGMWCAKARVEGAYCDSGALLTYLEGGWKASVELFLQGGTFFIDNWNDRIYVYQRDAPQTFSTVAMYGRGMWFSCYAKATIGRHVRLYFRIADTSYPWARESDTRQAHQLQVRLQAVFQY